MSLLGDSGHNVLHEGPLEPLQHSSNGIVLLPGESERFTCQFLSMKGHYVAHVLVTDRRLVLRREAHEAPAWFLCCLASSDAQDESAVDLADIRAVSFSSKVERNWQSVLCPRRAVPRESFMLSILLAKPLGEARAGWSTMGFPWLLEPDLLTYQVVAGGGGWGRVGVEDGTDLLTYQCNLQLAGATCSWPGAWHCPPPRACATSSCGWRSGTRRCRRGAAGAAWAGGGAGGGSSLSGALGGIGGALGGGLGGLLGGAAGAAALLGGAGAVAGAVAGVLGGGGGGGSGGGGLRGSVGGASVASCLSRGAHSELNRA
ncbi:hypothetical protein HYH03_003528 [Edaphochlamys debaryana]|uniref:Uncharacterized protein n=1 Tax=Edaphochlamys debaryana TaxID=47281 RepID=A0A836C4H9_9CHLO|nr:hypothetical protein HYH03_003528 [Edaphochlamys debaryana]|eukprot:KAG2498789.1 hypothetical protein HYH03_003528 [Edaphochlamys debaryana]